MKYLKEFGTKSEYDAFVESGTMQKPNVSLVSETNEVFYHKYVVPLKNGVYIQHIDNSLYTTEEWTAKGFANEESNGVAVVADEAKFVIAKTDVSTSTKWSSNTPTLVDGIFTSTDGTLAKTDYAGKLNTEKMLAYDTSGAGYFCVNYTFPNGDKGYLPALGEWDVAYKNKSAVDAAMTAIGGTAIGSRYYWSSTQYSLSNAWLLHWNLGITTNYIKNNTNSVRAFSALSL